MDSEEAVGYLVSRLPGFAPYVDEHRRAYGELLIHPLMGDLGRYYMAAGVGDVDLAVRYWNAVGAISCCGRCDR